MVSKNQKKEPMDKFEADQLKYAAECIERGHQDQQNLRELLILTTDRSTAAMIDRYFAKHHHDSELLQNLIEIALEGEDNGDAPWAAANTLADFPSDMLKPFRRQIEEISKEQWIYLNQPAKLALEKIDRGEPPS